MNAHLVHIVLASLLLLPWAAQADCFSDGGPRCTQTGEFPFYQPPVSAAEVDVVTECGLVQQSDGGVNTCFPSDNLLRLRTDWAGPGSDETSITWDAGSRTGFWPPTPWASYQRGKLDAVGSSVLQIQGTTMGMYLNTMDFGSAAPPYGGGNSATLGCWYSNTAGPKPFVAADSALDIDLDLIVKRDQTLSLRHCVDQNGHPGPTAAAIVYIDLIFRDLSFCDILEDGGTDFHSCTKFTLTIGLYDRRTNSLLRFHTDTAAEQYNVGMIAGALPDNANGWLSVRGGSWGDAGIEPNFQSTPYNQYKHFAFRISQAQFEKLLVDLKNWVANPANGVSDGGQARFGAMSSDASDFRLAHYAVIAETWDPTNDPVFYDCGGPIDEFEPTAEIGLSARGLRLSSVTPHEVQRGPFGYDSNGTARVVYLANNGDVNEFFWDGNTNRFAHYGVSPAAGRGFDAGTPMGYWAGTNRVVFRGSDSNVYERFIGTSGWTGRKMTENALDGTAAGDPFGYIDPSNQARVVYRGNDGHIHELQLTPGLPHRDLTSIALPYLSGDTVPNAVGDPTAFVAGSASRVLYRATDGHLHELYEWGGQWTDFDMSDIPDAGVLSSRASGFVDTGGEAHVVYVDSNGHVHDLITNAVHSYHRDLTAESGAAAAVGAPSGFATPGERHVVFRDVNYGVQELRIPDAGSAYLGSMSTTLGMMPAGGDPVGFMSGGSARVFYPATDVQIHALTSDGGVDSWQHFEL